MALTTFTAGTKAKASEVNSNFDLLYPRIKKFTFTSAAEETHTGDTNWTTLKTGTLTPDDTTDNRIVAVRTQFEVKISGAGDTASGRIEITEGGSLAVTMTGTQKNNGTTSYVAFDFLEAVPTTLGFDNSYTVNMQAQVTSAAKTVSIQNVVITVYMVQGEMDSSSPSFS